MESVEQIIECLAQQRYLADEGLGVSLYLAIQLGRPLLIDEIDRADDEFEAFLLEFLAEFQITIPELGTVRAQSQPIVVLTSNRTRDIHDALKRRCLYHWIDYPSHSLECRIIAARAPEVPAKLAEEVVSAVFRFRDLELLKPPGVAESIDRARGLKIMGASSLADSVPVERTLG